MTRITSMDPKECEVCIELEAQVAEVMRLAHEYAICNGEELISRKVKGPEAKALVHATQGAIAALDAAVRKLAGLPANSETAARAETE